MNSRHTNTLTQPLSIVVSAWNQNRVTPNSNHYLGVTIGNRGDQDAVVQVRLESPSDLLRQWCSQPEQWLALSSGKSGELTFCIAVPGDALPQWLEYEVVARPQGVYAEDYLAPTRCRLQVLAPEISETSQDPTFSLSPLTTLDRPLIVQPGTPVTAELQVENRSERVDRFRLECTGLPEDWTVQIDYPRDFDGFGLVRSDDSLGVNPGDRGLIRVVLQPPELPLAGSYLPTFRLASENQPTLGLLALIYLRVDPVYRLQAQLRTVQDQVRDRPAQFTLEFANLGNTPRQVQLALQPQTPPEACTYALPDDRLTVAPQTVGALTLEAQPRRWWTRPWWGDGKPYAFRVQLQDAEQHAIVPETLQGQLMWLPRPWWQWLLAILAGLGALGTLVFLIWWFFWRPPTPPNVLEFAAEDSRYAEANGDMARVRWQIENPQQIQQIKLTGYSPEGTVLSGPLVYELTDGKLPAALQSFCIQEKMRLSCSQVRTDAFLPGKYVFDLTLTVKGRTMPIVLKTSAIEITPKPLPTVTALVPKALIYREAGASTPEEKRIPVIDANGIRLDWSVATPGSLTALHLIGRDLDGNMVGDLWFEFSNPNELPTALRPFCKLGQTLICRNVPTGLTTPGEYRFELQTIAGDEPTGQPDAKPKLSETVKIQSQAPQILSLQLNGQEAPTKLLIPIASSQRVPPLQVSWRVQGSASTQVELLPAPGSVPLVGSIRLPLSPQGSSTLSLQVKTPSGQVLTRSVMIETYDPKQPAATPAASPPPPPPLPPTPPSSAASPNPAPASPPPFGAPMPSLDDRLSPSEQPPQFNR